MSSLVNPDSRPLPPGWNQHYDAHTDIWYYICINVRPPTVSTTHPLGLIPDGNNSSASLPSPEYSYAPDLPEAELSSNSLGLHSPTPPPVFNAFPDPQVTMPTSTPSPSNAGSRPLPPHPSNIRASQRPVSSNPPPSPAAFIQPRASGLTFAQQLYSSSVKTAYPGPTAPAGARQAASGSIPTPPTSPQPRSSRSSAPILPPPPPPNARSAYENNDLFSVPVIPDSRSYASHRASIYSPTSPPSLGAFPKPAPHSSTNHTAPHRAQSYQPAKYAPHPNPHRASTFSAKTRGTPQLTTTARPPSSATHAHLAAKPHTTPSFQAAASPPPQLHLQNPPLAAPVPSYPTPPNSGGPAATLNAAAYQIQNPLPPSPAAQVQMAYQMQAQMPAQPMQVQVQPQMQVQVQPQIQLQVQPQMQLQVQPQLQLQMQPQNPGPSQQQQQQRPQQPQQPGALQQLGVGLGKMTLDVAGGALMASLGLQTNGIGGAIGGALVGAASEDGDVMSSLVDGLAGMGGGDQGGGVDYQSMLAAMGQQQGQQQQQDPMAQLQAAMAQQQAQQQQPMAQFQAAMAQQQAQQQQQLQQQAMTAQQQQQLQLQMQMQLLQQQQQAQAMALQQNVAQQQQPSPLGTLLTGFGQALSSMATDNSGNADQGGSWDAYASLLTTEE